VEQATDPLPGTSHPDDYQKLFNENKKLQSEVDLLREEIARLWDTLLVGLRSHAINSNSADI
jgi:cell division septum initiation protein DivIVA